MSFRPFTLVDTPSALISLLTLLSRLDLNTSPPSLYLDLEGTPLSRSGHIVFLQLYVLPVSHTYIIDMHVLGRSAIDGISISIRRPRDHLFPSTPPTGPSKSPFNLRTVLTDPTIPIAIFDVRSDSDALFHLFGIRLAGIHDLQVMEYACRPSWVRSQFVLGLARCVELGHGVGLSSRDRNEFKKVKEMGKRLFEQGSVPTTAVVAASGASGGEKSETGRAVSSNVYTPADAGADTDTDANVSAGPATPSATPRQQKRQPTSTVHANINTNNDDTETNSSPWAPWLIRPIPTSILTYCVGDVWILPRLWSYYRERIRSMDEMEEETQMGTRRPSSNKEEEEEEEGGGEEQSQDQIWRRCLAVSQSRVQETWADVMAVQGKERARGPWFR